MAEDLAERMPAAVTPRAAKRRHPALRGRFLLAYLVLGLIAGAAIAGAFVLFTQSERASSEDWAAWHPVGEQATYGQQIADHVARRYRTDDGDQIVGVVPGPPEVQGPDSSVKVEAVLVRQQNAASSEDVKTLSADDSYMYLLCGLGNSCTVRGPATEERHRLLRREALELALYTFKYMDGVKTVIALLPPPASSQESPNAVFLEKDDFKTELSRPLAETIGRPDAETLTEVPELETVRVDRLTLPFVFDYQFAGLPNQTAALILSPVKSAG
ncbi:MAG TPA: hypothetical protein VGQ15_11765 [Gaiellaceae bacterium]|jgi:hypothetical protein|nr:hypothetical protein [Gaiellaceae bacterium]